MFLPLSAGWEPTRAALHAHAAIAGVVARAHAVPHPSWWHVGLRPTAAGLETSPLPLPDGGEARLILDVAGIEYRVKVAASDVARFDLTSSPSRVAAAVFETLADLGLEAGYDDGRLHSDPGRLPDRAHAAAFWAVLLRVSTALEEQRARRPGDPGPVVLWPHGFDVSFEWFGSRRVDDPETGAPARAQLNLGWYPGGDAYFYSNPWPLDERLVGSPLPPPARWHHEGWQGTMLRYDAVVGTPDGPERFARYAEAVFDLTRPTLDAEPGRP